MFFDIWMIRVKKISQQSTLTAIKASCELRWRSNDIGNQSALACFVLRPCKIAHTSSHTGSRLNGWSHGVVSDWLFANKSSIPKNRAPLWNVIYGHRFYVAIVAAVCTNSEWKLTKAASHTSWATYKQTTKHQTKRQSQNGLGLNSAHGAITLVARPDLINWHVFSLITEILVVSKRPPEKDHCTQHR